MLKNKKKLRRIERNTPGYAVKTAQSLVLAGALVLGGAGMASAATLVGTTLNGFEGEFTSNSVANISATDQVQPVIIFDGVNSTTITSANSILKITSVGGLQIGNTNAADAGLFDVANGKTLNMNDALLQIGGHGGAGAVGGAGTLNVANTGILSNLGNITIGGAAAANNGGAGTMTLTGNGATAYVFNYEGGTLTVGGNKAAAVVGSAGAGALNVGGAGTAGNIGNAGTLGIAVGSALVVNNVGTVNIGGAGTTDTSGANAGQNGGAGMLNIAGTANLSNASAFNVGGLGSGMNTNGSGGNGGTGVVTVQNGGVLTIDQAVAAIKIGGNGGAADGGNTNGSGGNGTLTVATGGTLNLTGVGATAIHLGGTVGTGGADGTIGIGTANIAGTMNVSGANAVTLTINNNAANSTGLTIDGGTLNVGTAAATGVVAKHGLLTLAGNGNSLLVNNGGVVNVTSNAANTSSLEAVTSVMDGQLNLIGTTNGSTHTGAVTLNGNNAVLNAVGGATATKNTLSAGLTFGANGGTVNVGDADNAGFLTVTSPLTIANGGVVNVDNGSTLTSATSLTKGSLNLIDGSTHDGNVTLNGSAGNAAMVEVAGGTVAKPNAITGALLTNGAASEGIVTVGTAGAGNEAVLTVSAASTLGDNAGAAGTRVTMNVAKGSTAAFTSAASGLIIDKGAEVTASSYKNTATLAGNTGLLVANNGVTVNNGGVLNILGDHIFNSATANTTMVLTSGTLRVAGELSTGADTVAIANNQSLVAKTFKSGVVATDSIVSGSLTLLGTGNAANTVLTSSTAAGFTVNGGTLNLGSTTPADLSGLGLAADYAQGGTINEKVTVSSGALNVKTGNWSMANATDGLTVSGGTVVIDGNLTADTLKATGGTVTVNGGGKLTTKLANFGKLDTAAVPAGLTVNVTGANTSAKIAGSGALVVTGVVTDGSYKLDTVNLAGATAIRTAVMSGNGTLKLQDYKVTTNAATDRLSAAGGLELSDATLGLTTTETIASNTTVKDLMVQPTIIADIDITTGVNTLTLVGAGAGKNLIAGLTGTQKVDIDVATGGLALGSAAGTSTGGILNANITNTGTISSTNGDFEVSGTVAATQTAINVTGKSLNFTKGNITTTASTLDGGVLGATDKTAGSLTITTLNTTANGGVVAAFKNLSVGAGTGTLKGNTVMLAGDTITLTTGINATDEATLTIGAVGNVGAAGFGITTEKGALSVVASGANSTIVAGAITAGNGAQLTLHAGNSIAANSVAGGANSLVSAKTLTVATTVDLAGGTLNLTDTGTTGSTVTGKFNLGTADATTKAITNVVGTVAGKLTLGAGGDVVGGSSLKADTLALTGTLNVGSNVEGSTGVLSVTKLADGGTIFADPAWIAGTEHATSYASQVAIEGFTTAGELKSNIIGGQASQIVIGTSDTAWVKNKLDVINSAHGGNIWGPEVSQVTAALGITKAVSVTTGNLIIDGTSNGTAGTAGDANFGSNSLLIVDANGVGAANTALTATNITVGADAKLMMTNVTVGETYKLATAGTGNLLIDPTSWQDGNLLTDHRLLMGVLDHDITNATVTIDQVAAQSVMPKLSNSMGGLIDGMIAQGHTSEDSPHTGVRFVNRAINRLNGESAAATIEGAAQMAAVAGVQVSTIGAASVASGAVTTRTSFAQPLMDMTKAVAVHQDNDGALSLDTGLNAGNGMKNGLGVWIMPLYQSNKTWGQKAENFKSGMNSDLGGIALGADYTINDMFRFGAAFNVGAGYGQSTGDFNKTENRFNFWGVNLYGGWTMNNFGLSADVGYTSTFNAVKQDTPASLQMGNLKSDVTSSALQAGLKAEYKLETSVVDIIPHVGVRYMGLATDGYDVKSHGTVFSVERDFQSIWTFPIGVAFSKTITSDSGWMFKPMVDLSVVPAAGDIKAKSKTSIPGVGGQAEMKMQVVDTVTFDGGLGFEVGKDNLSFGLNYNVQASEHRTGHGVFGTLRYEF